MFFIGVDLLLDGVGHHVGDDIGRENQVRDESFRRRKSDAEYFIQLYSYKVGQRLELITKGDATLGVAFAQINNCETLLANAHKKEWSRVIIGYRLLHFSDRIRRRVVVAR